MGLSFTAVFLGVGVLLCVCVLGAGCLRQDHGVGEVSPSKLHTSLEGPIKALEKSKRLETKINPKGPITLRQALALALIQSPALKDYAWDVRAKEAATLTAKRVPNPELELNVEDLLGSGVFSKVKAMEITASLSQLIELGGKRSARIRVARAAAKTAGWDYELVRIRTLSQISKDFLAVYCAQRCLAQTRQMVELAKTVVEVFKEKVDAGKVSPLQVGRAQLTLAMARLEFGRAQRMLEASRQVLGLHWGVENPRFSKVVAELPPMEPPPPLPNLTGRLRDSPHLARWASFVEEKRRLVSLEKSLRIPDMSVRAGYRYVHESRDSALVFGLSIPIPIFHQNKGGVLRAKREVKKAQSQAAAKQLRLKQHLAKMLKELGDAYEETRILQREVLPKAESNFQKIKEGYRLGKFNFLAVLDSQNTLFESQRRQKEAYARYYAARVDIEALLGAPLETKNTEANKNKKTNQEHLSNPPMKTDPPKPDRRKAP